MKKLFWRALFFLVPFLYSIYVCSQPANKDCSTTCFKSQVISIQEISPLCRSYEMEVTYSGGCAHALSHYSVAVPCGEISDISNSQNWPQVVGTDPTTGLKGFKIDDIQDFGESATTSFRVKFTVCSADEACAGQFQCWQPLVAYKASTCVNYETVALTCKPLKASLQTRNASCFGAANGSLAVIVEDGREPFSFLWSDNSSAQTLENIVAGDYWVIVKDASGAEIKLSAKIDEPEGITIEGTSTLASCSGQADGAIDITVSGGSAPYTFSWNNGASTEDITSLAAGQYLVTVRDSKDCSTTARFTVSNRSALSLAVTLTAPDCKTSNGSIDLTVAGGAEPYSFQWSNGELTEDLTSVAAGLYAVTVIDNTGCSAQRSVFLKENNTLLVKAVSTPASCSGDASGSIDLTVSGGTGPYTYTWSNGSSTEDLSSVESGFYTVTIEDSKGCTVTASYTVMKKSFQIPHTIEQPTCNGDGNGSITLLEPIGGTAPYSYQWSNGETGPTLKDLAPGSYTVTVTDATGCSKTLTLTLSAPAPITTSTSVISNACDEQGSSTIDLTVSGGTAPYTYEWSNGNSTEDIEGVARGTYTVIITDAKGCTVSKDVVVESSALLVCLIDAPAVAPVCGSVNNVLSTSVSDAENYSWSIESTDNSWTLTSSTTPSITYTAGSQNSTATFTLTITKNGCTKTCSYTMVGGCAPDPSGEQPGGEEPGGEQPGGQTPGEGGNENCETCFNTVATIIASSGECRTYEVKVNTNGLCAHDLSHWTIAIPCGQISDYSNSGGWKMEFGHDPTTGLYGLKVDGISNFGKKIDSFAVRFTLCGTHCDLADWTPIVAYKAGQCTGTEEITANSLPAAATSLAVYPNPFNDVVHFEWEAVSKQINLDIIDQYGNMVMHTTASETDTGGFYLDLETSSLPKGMYYYRLRVDGQTYNGKLSKR